MGHSDGTIIAGDILIPKTSIMERIMNLGVVKNKIDDLKLSEECALLLSKFLRERREEM